MSDVASSILEAAVASFCVVATRTTCVHRSLRMKRAAAATESLSTEAFSSSKGAVKGNDFSTDEWSGSNGNGNDEPYKMPINACICSLTVQKV